MNIFATNATLNVSEHSAVETCLGSFIVKHLHDELPTGVLSTRHTGDPQESFFGDTPIIFNEKQWEAFTRQIAAPPETHPGLVALFKNPTAFE